MSEDEGTFAFFAGEEGKTRDARLDSLLPSNLPPSPSDSSAALLVKLDFALRE